VAKKPTITEKIMFTQEKAAAFSCVNCRTFNGKMKGERKKCTLLVAKTCTLLVAKTCTFLIAKSCTLLFTVYNMVKEYIQLTILDYLSTTPFIRKLCFIGGTNLRLVRGIDRFSEDLDFDCKNLSREEFSHMSGSVLRYLEHNGYGVELRDKENPKLSAFRSNLYFPQLLFDLGLSGLKEERFLIKIEAQDQGVDYTPNVVNIEGCGYYFPLPVPSDSVIFAMKTTALLDRNKGRDFYDLMFLLGQTSPDYDFLVKKRGIESPEELKKEIFKVLKRTNLNVKMKDFEHLLFNKNNSRRILRFKEYFMDVI
jgi:predicted nucleotidyltransferase component of viral defense system